MNEHRPERHTRDRIERADTRARTTTSPPEHASPPEKASSQNTTSTTRLHRDCTLDERQSAHSTAHFTARLSTCTDQPSPPGKTSPPERSASPTIFQGYRSPRRDESWPPANLPEDAQHAFRPNRRQPARERPPRRTARRALTTRRGGTPTWDFCPTIFTRAALVTLTTLTLERRAVGSHWRDHDRSVNPGGRWRGIDLPASPRTAPPTSHTLRWGASLNTAARTRASALPDKYTGLRATILAIVTQRGQTPAQDSRQREKIKERYTSTHTIRSNKCSWYNSRTILYIDHRLPWQVEGSAGNYA